MHGQGGTSALPTAKAKILHGGTFVTICRLASCNFSVTAQGVTFSHPKFSDSCIGVVNLTILIQIKNEGDWSNCSRMCLYTKLILRKLDFQFFFQRGTTGVHVVNLHMI